MALAVSELPQVQFSESDDLQDIVDKLLIANEVIARLVVEVELLASRVTTLEP